MSLYSNPIVLKIHDGTPRSDVNLCPSCRNAHVMTEATGRKTVTCQAVYNQPRLIRNAVVSCSMYADRMQPTLSDMNEIAWTLMTDKGGRKLGFEPPNREGQHPTPAHGF